MNDERCCLGSETCSNTTFSSSTPLEAFMKDLLLAVNSSTTSNASESLEDDDADDGIGGRNGIEGIGHPGDDCGSTNIKMDQTKKKNPTNTVVRIIHDDPDSTDRLLLSCRQRRGDGSFLLRPAYGSRFSKNNSNHNGSSHYCCMSPLQPVPPPDRRLLVHSKSPVSVVTMMTTGDAATVISPSSPKNGERCSYVYTTSLSKPAATETITASEESSSTNTNTFSKFRENVVRRWETGITTTNTSKVGDLTSSQRQGSDPCLTSLNMPKRKISNNKFFRRQSSDRLSRSSSDSALSLTSSSIQLQQQHQQKVHGLHTSSGYNNETWDDFSTTATTTIESRKQRNTETKTAILSTDVVDRLTSPPKLPARKATPSQSLTKVVDAVDLLDGSAPLHHHNHHLSSVSLLKALGPLAPTNGSGNIGATTTGGHGGGHGHRHHGGHEQDKLQQHRLLLLSKMPSSSLSPYGGTPTSSSTTTKAMTTAAADNDRPTTTFQILDSAIAVSLLPPRPSSSLS